jgi:hypothetical protein
MDIQQEVHTIEEELLALITKRLEENQIEVEKAQQLAKDFLAILPVADQQELLIKLRDLSGKYEEIKPFYMKEYAKVDDMKRDEVLTHMRNAIHTGSIDSAIDIAKAYTNVKGGSV